MGNAGDQTSVFTSGAATTLVAVVAGTLDMVASSSLESYPAPSRDAILHTPKQKQRGIKPLRNRRNWVEAVGEGILRAAAEATSEDRSLNFAATAQPRHLPT